MRNRELSYFSFFRSMSSYTSFPLDDPTPLLNSSCLDPSLPTVLYTFGYRGKSNGPATTAMLNGYIATKKRNVLLLDWEEEAKSGILGIALSYAMFALPNCKRIGQELGGAIQKLDQAGFQTDKLHLIGHSLGAHLMGYTGRWSREQGITIPRITGLDPARALFEGLFSIQSGLDRTCAKFVDIVHTNPGNYGSTKSTGSVDIWPNYSSDGMQPGCPVGKYEMFSMDDLCSHNRAVMYVVESLSDGTSFPAAAAESYSEWIALEDPTNDTIYLGDLVNIRARGNYYLSTKAQSPFGMGMEGLEPNNQTRTRRQSVFQLNNLLNIIRKPFSGGS
ncbi:putative endothelial lipase isoform X2 [Zerene cesonia]|uniref:putative endothelial lipase isoform X2 n=1 Tax=Zerene cesonia TaxID=33412 RepID=UPI0018E4E172|nr:putative endothelial lipase isoform X2 [Zerene cesonia]